MKFAHLRVIINPFGTLRAISIFNYHAMDSFFTQYFRHIVLLQKVTTCFMNCTRALVWLWGRGLLLFHSATGWWTFTSTYSKLERQIYHLKKKQRVCGTVCTSGMVFHPAQEAPAQLLCRSGGGSWHHSSEMWQCVDKAHSPTTSGSPCTSCSSRELSVLSPWSWSYCSFFPHRGWLKMGETILSLSTLCEEFLKQGKGIGVFAGDYFWIINYL